LLLEVGDALVGLAEAEVRVGAGEVVDREALAVGLGFALDRVGVALGRIGVIVGADALLLGRAAGRRVARQVGRCPYRVGVLEVLVVRGAGLYVDRGLLLSVAVGFARQGRWLGVAETSSVSVPAAAPEAAAGAGTAVIAEPVPRGSVPNRMRPATARPTTPAAVAEASRARLGIM
jgi:hypothetical protein